MLSSADIVASLGESTKDAEDSNDVAGDPVLSVTLRLLSIKLILVS